MLHPWESFFNQPEASFLPLANMSRRSRVKVQSLSRARIKAWRGLLPEPLRLALDLFVAVFIVGSFAATIVIFISVVPATFSEYFA
jgi:hypothetical protein